MHLRAEDGAWEASAIDYYQPDDDPPKFSGGGHRLHSTARDILLERAREPDIFLPPGVEAIRAQLDPRDRTLVSVLAYSGPRPEEVVCRLAWSDVGEHAIRYQDTKRHRVRHTPPLKPLANDLREWSLASGWPTGTVWCSQPTTVASGSRTTGATGGDVSGRANPSGPPGTVRARSLHVPVCAPSETTRRGDLRSS